MSEAAERTTTELEEEIAGADVKDGVNEEEEVKAQTDARATAEEKKDDNEGTVADADAEEEWIVAESIAEEEKGEGDEG